MVYLREMEFVVNRKMVVRAGVGLVAAAACGGLLIASPADPGASPPVIVEYAGDVSVEHAGAELEPAVPELLGPAYTVHEATALCNENLTGDALAECLDAAIFTWCAEPEDCIAEDIAILLAGEDN